jgi:hypothetical protein
MLSGEVLVGRLGVSVPLRVEGDITLGGGAVLQDSLGRAAVPRSDDRDLSIRFPAAEKAF